MSKRYLNPPIIEAVCEFRLAPDSKWDLTVPGLIYEKVREAFPNKEQHLVQEVEIAQNPLQGVEQQIRTKERILFLADDRKTFIQLGTHLLAINRLKPYLTWNNFKPNIEEAFNALLEVVEITTLSRIGLRYINRVEIPVQGVQLEDYFEFRPYLGPSLPANPTDFVIGCLFSFHEGRDSCRVQFTRAVSEKPDNTSFLIDLDYFLAKPETILADHALEWVEDAHQGVEGIFEACVGNRLREMFQEEK